jgi:CoA:oxalate CoA-transferase
MNEIRGLPLQGVVVADLTQIYNGPYATYLMAMAGARVIKIEPPGGEHLRKRGANSGAAMPFAMLNGNKESVRIDLKTPEGKALFLKLIERVDVVVENFAPGVMDRLGIGKQTLLQHNPALIYASGSGYGNEGLYSSFPAMDLTVQAMSGVMSVTGEANGPPMKVGPAICDFFGGTHLYGAIVTALFERERSGKGRSVEVSMMESVYASLSSNLGLYFSSDGEAPMRTGNRHGGLSLCPYNVYPTQDGYIAIICNHQDHWEGLISAMNREDLKNDERMVSMKVRVANIDLIDDLIAQWTEQFPKQILFEKLIEYRVPCAPVRDLKDVVNDPHMHARGMLEKITHPEYGVMTVSRSPLRFDDSPNIKLEPSQRLGESNRTIFSDWLGLSAAEIDALADKGVI